MHRNVFDSVDGAFRGLCNSSGPFDGRIVYLADDFGQALPVVPESGRGDIVSSTVQQCSF